MHHHREDSWHDPLATAAHGAVGVGQGARAGADERTEGRAVYAPGQLTTERPAPTHMADDIDEVEAPEELIEEDLEELADDDDLIADDPLLDDDDDVAVAVIDVEEEEPDVPTGTAKAVAKAAGEETDEEEEEEPDDEDVEASLDTILKERLVVEEVEDDEETPEPEDRSGDGVERVLPKQPGEFVCRSCFLVKHGNQLADKKKMLCRDCV